MQNTMMFKSYTFEYNPTELKIEHKRNQVEIKLPGVGSIVQDLGLQTRVIKGSGEFFGSDCKEKEKAFEKLVESQESGLLVIPDLEPINALLHSFTVNLKDLPESISYSFEFWEDRDSINNSSVASYKKYHTVVKGESLWSIATNYGTTVAELLKLNPEVKRPDNIKIGQRIVIA